MTNTATTALPLTPVEPTPLTPEQERLVRMVADRLDDEFNFPRERVFYREQFLHESPTDRARMVHVDDFSVIPNINDIRGVDFYQSRAFTRTRENDVVVGTFDPIQDQDRYLRDFLQLGVASYLQAAQNSTILPYATFSAILRDEQALENLSALAKESEQLLIHPYMGVANAWTLAKVISEGSRNPVRVVGPLPRVSQYANNKVVFNKLVAELFGQDAVPMAEPARSRSEIIEHLIHLAQRGGKVALKLADGASGMGTGVFESNKLLQLSPAKLEQYLTQWLDDYQYHTSLSHWIQIERWEPDVLVSPSAQVWIPPESEGPPIVEGIYDQLFTPENAIVFLGSRPSTLHEELQERIRIQTAMLGRVFQHIGYIGRCSFDLICCGSDLADCTIKFVECNGRWGGTSTPMTLMNRLFGDYRRQPYLAGDFVSEKLQGISFKTFLKNMNDILYHKGKGTGWAIIYNLAALEPSGKFDVITLGKTQNEAEKRREEFEQLVNERF